MNRMSSDARASTRKKAAVAIATLLVFLVAFFRFPSSSSALFGSSNGKDEEMDEINAAKALLDRHESDEDEENVAIGDRFVVSDDDPYAGGVHLISTFFKGNYHEERFKEITDVLNFNLRNKYIARVHILYEDENPTSYVYRDQDANKLVATKVDKQPTYQQLFDYASDTLKRGSVGLIANGDIYFDETIRCMSPMNPESPNMSVPPKAMPRLVALSRRKAPQCGKNQKDEKFSGAKDLCHTYVGSHDAFMFAPPVRRGITSKLKHTQNQALGAENLVIWEFQAAGYKVINPCTMVRANHLHCSGERNYKVMDKNHRWKVMTDAKFNGGVEKYGMCKPNPGRFPANMKRNCPTQIY